MNDKAQVFGALAISAALLGGCVTPTQEITPAASPPTVVVAQATPPAVVVSQPAKVITYPEGRYELRGEGTATLPYYWVWVPTGVVMPMPPPPPAIVR